MSPVNRANAPRKPKTGIKPIFADARPRERACPLIRRASYWVADAKEMAALNTILIIVNSTSP